MDRNARACQYNHCFNHVLRTKRAALLCKYIYDLGQKIFAKIFLRGAKYIISKNGNRTSGIVIQRMRDSFLDSASPGRGGGRAGRVLCGSCSGCGQSSSMSASTRQPRATWSTSVPTVRCFHDINLPILFFSALRWWVGRWVAEAQKEKALEIKGLSLILAEREGFEPSEPCGSLDFESSTIDHSATSPDSVVCSMLAPQSTRV